MTDKEFEGEIAKIARLLWPSAEGGGPIFDDGRERDGIYVTEDFVYAIECTLSRRLDKAEEDGTKLSKLCRRLEVEHPTKHVKGWFITFHDPTAEQRTEIERRKEKIVAVSYEQFRSRLVDASSYLNARREYPFGSVRDPETGSTKVSLNYVAQNIFGTDGVAYTIDGVAESLTNGNRFVLLGDYGAGKSSALREIFEVAAKNFWRGKTLRFPVLLNLRDHHGQTNTAEALERHAWNVGFTNKSHLVRAWRAGYVTLMLDGFDEIATAGWAGRTKKLRDLRFRSMELVREFVRDTPVDAGVVIAGREHFFDTPKERNIALGAEHGFRDVALAEFSAKQVEEFLLQAGWKDHIPEWVPARPLLLAYLASRGLLAHVFAVEAGSSAAMGWNALLDRVSQRESEIEAGIDAGTVRLLIERIATLARSSADALGPLSPDQILDAFAEVCGYAPDDRGAVLLQRLPGLGGSSAADGSRQFVDRDFADSASAGTVFHFVEHPFASTLDSSTWQSSLSPLGVEVCALRCSTAKYSTSKLAAALAAASSTEQSVLTADIMQLFPMLGESYVGSDTIFIKEALIPELNLGSSATLGNVQLQECIVVRLVVDVDAALSTFPEFINCYFTHIEGRVGENDLPVTKFKGCTFDEFEDSANTTNALLALSLPIGVKVLLTVLKKLYAQSGRGRKESALFRGLDNRAQQMVPGILSLLKREGFITDAYVSSQRVYLSTRGSDKRTRALRILTAPNTCGDALIKAAGDL